MRSTERGAAVVLERLLAAVVTLAGTPYAALLPLDAGGDPIATRGTVPSGAERALLERPVRAGGRVVALLRVAPATRGPAVDDVADALASVAGMVLEQGRIHERGEERLRWLEASARLTQVFAPPLDVATAFVEVVRMARSLAGATGVALVRRKEDVVQPLAADGQRWSAFEPLVAQTRWYQDDGAAPTPELLRLSVPAGLLVVAPMTSQVKGAAALLATFATSPEPELVGLLCAFAGQAAFAFDRAQVDDSDDRLRTLSERERVARDLHDQVMQRLFGIGLQLQAVHSDVAEPGVRERLEEVATELDRTVSAIRSTIFTLREAGQTEPGRPTSEQP